MKTVKKENKESGQEIKPKVKSYSKFRNARMVRIEGNFMGGGFNISQNKIKAIIENMNELTNFANGVYDSQIDALADDEIIEV